MSGQEFRIMEASTTEIIKNDLVELIENLFNTGEIKPESIRELICKNGGLSRLIRSGENAMKSTASLVSEKKIRRITSALELGKRALIEETTREAPLLNASEVFQYLVPRIGWPEAEEFWVLALDVRQRPILFDMVAKGTIEEVNITMAQIFKLLIKVGAPRGICCHTHPSGDPSPSDSDISITDSILEAGRLLGISIVDHIILGQGAYVSLAEKGYL